MGAIFCVSFSFLALDVMVFNILEEDHERVKNNAVCRTAPAKLGLIFTLFGKIPFLYDMQITYCIVCKWFGGSKYSGQTWKYILAYFSSLSSAPFL